MPLFSIDLSEEFQSFLIVEALSAAIGIGVMKLHSGRTFVSVLGYRVSRFSDGVFIGKICTVVQKFSKNYVYTYTPIRTRNRVTDKLVQNRTVLYDLVT